MASLSHANGMIVALAVGIVSIGCAPAKPPQAKSASTAASHNHDHDHVHDHGKKSDHDDHDHDHGDHAAHDSLAGALTELEKICARVKDELGKKNLDEADGHVHMVGHLVDDMHRLVDTSKLAEDAKAAAKTALDEVFDCFDKLDTALHSSDEKVKQAIDYLEHEPRIQAALGELKKAAAAVNEGLAKAPQAVEKTADDVKQSVGRSAADQ